MMEFFLGHITEKFERENGRAPDEVELETLKAALTEKLGGMGMGAAMMGGEEEGEELDAIEEGDEEEIAEKIVKKATKRSRDDEDEAPMKKVKK